MASNLVGDADGLAESIRGLTCGIVFGLTSPLLGQPLDTIKTHMQASVGSAKGSALTIGRKLVLEGGIRSLYKGLLPPLIGSSIFRSVQFSAYSYAYASQRGSAGEWSLPGSGGVQARVLTAGLFASFMRSLIETPMEYVKVRQQMGLSVLGPGGVASALSNPLGLLPQLYTGFGVSFLRTWGLMGSFFVFVDILERQYPQVLAIPYIGPFVKGGGCATAAWILIWPFEVIKNQIQAGTPGLPPGSNLSQRITWVMKERGGVIGLYRGIGPGLARSIIANGASMVAYSKCAELLFSGPR